MKQAIKEHTSEVLKDVIKGAKHIDALQVLDQEIEFLRELDSKFGSKPSKEETVVLAKYKNILDNKCAYLGQLIRKADVTLKGYGKLPFEIDLTHWSSIKQDLNITVVISQKEEG